MKMLFDCRGERNFHIFYYLYDGLSKEEKAGKYHLKEQNTYRYVKADLIVTMTIDNDRDHDNAMEYLIRPIALKRST